jgi:endonuclease G
MAILDSQTFSAAAERYKQRVHPNKTKPPAQGVTPSERNNYLSRKLAKDYAQLLAVDATAKGASQPPDQTVQQIAKERIIGSSDLVDINFLELALAIGRGVARIKVGNELATGVLVGPGLLMTNNHVIASAKDAAAALAQFDYQDNAEHDLLPVHQFRFDPARFFVTDATLDYSIVAAEQVSDKGKSISEYPWTPLIGDTGKAEAGDPVNIIQHPAGGLKQISFRKNQVIDIPKETKDFLYYTTDTEPGSSGSPCFNDQWELIALHHSGVPAINKNGAILKRDKTVWRKGIDPEGLIDWIANEGARVSAIVTSLKATALSNQSTSLRSEMLEGTPPNPIELARRNLDTSNDSGPVSRPISVSPDPSQTANESATLAMNQSVTLTLPLQITFSIGSNGTAPLFPSLGHAVASAARTVPAASVVRPGAPSDLAGAEEVTIDPDWSKRKGYDPNFLGIQVPFPKLSASQLANTVVVPPQFQAKGDKNLLNYFHYSVKMNQRRRSAWFSAAMIDGNRFIDFKRGKDRWFLDTRIDSKFQMGEELYAAPDTDHGHLTRFKDLSWGANKTEAVSATNDSFHFTNCTLQLNNFNQSQDRWQGLEQFLLENHARPEKRKMIVITGPVFKSSDPKYKNPSMDYTAQIPVAFWKVCVLERTDGSTAATAFTLGQEDITSLPGFEEKLDISTAQVTLADLESLTGFDFGDLKNHDVFAQTGEAGALEAFRPTGPKAKVKPIEDFTQIVI